MARWVRWPGDKVGQVARWPGRSGCQVARWPGWPGGQVGQVARWPGWSGGQVGPKVPRLKKVLFCAALSPGPLMESDLATAGLQWTTTLRDHSTRRIFLSNQFLQLLISTFPC